MAKKNEELSLNDRIVKSFNDEKNIPFTSKEVEERQNKTSSHKGKGNKNNRNNNSGKQIVRKHTGPDLSKDGS